MAKVELRFPHSTRSSRIARSAPRMLDAMLHVSERLVHVLSVVLAQVP
jgi:hypothetical protein